MNVIANRINRIGEWAVELIQHVGLAALLLGQLVTTFVTSGVALREFVKQLFFIGNRSVPVLMVSALFTGMVVALQFYDTLVRFGSVDLLGSAVALSLIRELGPVMTALMVIARVGSATCAEIGIMRNEQQFDALTCMAIDEKRFVLLPRFLAALVSVPILTALFDLVGMAGGYFVGVVVQGESAGAYIQGIFDTVTFADVWMGQVKSFIFGIVIIWLPLYFGYYIHLNRKAAGAQGVSNATTQAVVLSAILMLFSDYIISSLML